MPVLWGSEGDPMQERREALRAALAASECPTLAALFMLRSSGEGRPARAGRFLEGSVWPAKGLGAAQAVRK